MGRASKAERSGTPPGCIRIDFGVFSASISPIRFGSRAVRKREKLGAEGGSTPAALLSFASTPAFKAPMGISFRSSPEGVAK